MRLRLVEVVVLESDLDAVVGTGEVGILACLRSHTGVLDFDFRSMLTLLSSPMAFIFCGGHVVDVQGVWVRVLGEGVSLAETARVLQYFGTCNLEIRCLDVPGNLLAVRGGSPHTSTILVITQIV